MKPTGVKAAIRIGDDRYFDPAQVAIGFARAAAARGATLLPKTDVLTVNISAGKVIGVTTAKGTIEGPVVVDAAGAWTRQVAEASGVRVPLVPTRQQLIVTEPLDGARADLPMVRIMDAAVYTRPCQGGFLWGVYEETPRFFDMLSLGASFDVKDMPLDIEVLRSAAIEVKDQLPILQTAKVREFRGGIPTVTADGHHILGPAPGRRASILRADAMSPGFQSRQQSERLLQPGLSTANRPSIYRPCLSRASKTSRGPNLNWRGKPLGNIGISTARSKGE
jgi:4-methylaminobutanoate oxidase (formaldehyde-forming)